MRISYISCFLARWYCVFSAGDDADCPGTVQETRSQQDRLRHAHHLCAVHEPEGNFLNVA
jgi:hypothetical protein